jgi:hypothetical protein
VRASPNCERQVSDIFETSAARKAMHKQVLRLLNRIRTHPVDLAAPLGQDFEEVPRRKYFYVLKLPADEELVPYSVPYSKLPWDDRVELRQAPEISTADLELLPDPQPGEGGEEDEIVQELNANPTGKSESGQSEAKKEVNESELTCGQLIACLKTDEVRVMIARAEVKWVKHDFEQDPWCSDSDHSWNHWKPASETDEPSPGSTRVLLLRTRWNLAIDFANELSARFDLLALVTRRRIFPTDLWRPELLRALCPEPRNSRHARAMEAYRRYYEVTSFLTSYAHRVLEDFERKTRMTDPPEKERPLLEVCDQVNDQFMSLDLSNEEAEPRRPTSRQRR